MTPANPFDSAIRECPSRNLALTSYSFTPRVVAVGPTGDLMRVRAALLACLRPAAA
jgi:hypothetical protein